MMIVGIDPGIEGGICVSALSPKPNIAWIAAYKRPLPIVHDLNLTNCIVVIEDVHSSHQQGVVSAFTFGFNTGLWHGAIEIKQPLELITAVPSQWQKALGCRAHGDKGKLKEFAKSLVDDKRLTLKTCDAFLLAEYGRRLTYTSYI